jgi:ArsR family transcriptional regulator
VNAILDNPAFAESAAELLKAVGHPLRLRIIAALCANPTHVGGLAEQLDVAQPIISQQLRILRMRHLVGADRVAGRAVYRITQPHLRQMLRCVGGCVSDDPHA